MFDDEDGSFDVINGGRGYTPFARMGGKSRLAKRLIEMFPPEDAYNVYVEPFVGAGNVILRTEKVEGRKEVINDKDKRVIIVFRAIKKSGKKLNKDVNRHYLTRQQFDAGKDKMDAVNIIQTFKSSFFGQGLTYSPANMITRDNKEWQTDFEPIHDRIKNMTILNEDFTKVIKKYDSDKTFFYLDPPYENPKKTDYPDYVTPEMVINAVQHCKGYVMISYNDSPHIRKLFKGIGWKIKSVKTRYIGTQNIKTREVNELVIMNYE